MTAILITDDFSMDAVYGSREGIAAASVAALNAGVDLLLIAYDPAQYFAMMDAVLAADRDGSLRPAVLARSARRLAAVGALSLRYAPISRPVRGYRRGTVPLIRLLARGTRALIIETCTSVATA